MDVDIIIEETETCFFLNIASTIYPAQASSDYADEEMTKIDK